MPRLTLATHGFSSYYFRVSTVEEIQQAIEKLSLSERGKLAKWFNGWEDDDGDKQMAADFGPGGRYEHVPERRLRL
jgi:hypothetical protein